MYCYFITDEPSAQAFPALGKLVAYLRERDPAHMAYINLFPTYATNEQLGTTGDQVTAYREHLRQFVDVVQPELLSYDHYQFATDGDIDGYFLNLAMVRATAQEAGMPFLNIVQACSWTPSRRVPTGDEMRYLVYTTLAYGAQGISYYVYCCQGHTGGIARPTALRPSCTTPSRHSTASSPPSPPSCSRCNPRRSTIWACSPWARSPAGGTSVHVDAGHRARWSTSRTSRCAEHCSDCSARPRTSLKPLTCWW